MPANVHPGEGPHKDHEIVKFVGLNELEPLDQDMVRAMCTKACEKLMRKVPDMSELSCHIKCYGKKDGIDKQVKFSIHLACKAPSGVFDVDSAHDFDLARAMHKAFEDMEHRIDHALHTDVSSNRPARNRPPQHNRPSSRAK